MAFTLRLLQQNIGGSRQLTEEITAFAIDQEIDVILLHEPFNPEGKIEGFHPMVKVVTGTKSEKVALAAIAIFNNELEFWKVSELCNDRCVCVQLRGDFGDMFLVSLYSPLLDHIDSCLTTLQVLLQVLSEERILIGVDANAHSIWWSSTEKTDERGDKLEDLIISNSLCVLNRKDPLGLYWDGQSYSELSLVTYNIVGRIMEWHASNQWALDNRRTIRMELDLADYKNKNREYSTSPEVDEPRADEFDQVAFTNVTEDCDDDRVTSVCDEDNGQSACADKRMDYPWWTDNLDYFKREVCKARMKIQNDTDCNLMHHYKMYYMKRKRLYQRAIRMAKKAYYKQIVTDNQDNSEIKSDDNKIDFEANVPTTSSEGSTLHWEEYVLDFENKLFDNYTDCIE